MVIGFISPLLSGVGPIIMIFFAIASSPIILEVNSIPPASSTSSLIPMPPLFICSPKKISATKLFPFPLLW